MQITFHERSKPVDIFLFTVAIFYNVAADAADAADAAAAIASWYIYLC